MEKNKKFLLFLDDYRIPLNCISYMHQRIGKRNPIYLEKWVIAKNYDEFVSIITKNGMPEVISFDHDLADEHYIGADLDLLDRTEFTEKTGYDCAKWLIDYCIDNKKELPEIIVHSMNPVGTENILRLFANYQKSL